MPLTLDCIQVCKAYPHQHKLPFRSLEALGLWAPKTVESVARSMASGLVQQVQPQEAQPAPRSNSSRGPIPGQAPQYNMQPRPHNAEVSQHRDGEYSAQGSHSRLHELLTPSQAQALGMQPSMHIIAYPRQCSTEAATVRWLCRSHACPSLSAMSGRVHVPSCHGAWPVHATCAQLVEGALMYVIVAAKGPAWRLHLRSWDW